MKNFVKIFAFFTTLFSFVATTVPVLGENPFLKGGATALSGGIVDENSRAVMIVLDVSGSMSEPAPDAGTKILMAKQVLERVLSKIDGDIPVGLRVYGSSKPSYDPVVACQDSMLLVPPGTGNRGQMISKLRELKPSGATPISFSLRQAAQDLRYVDAKKKNIVLISDGMETCGSDPCDVARAFKAQGVDIQFNVVGFNVNDDYAAKLQLQCIAKASGGKYYDANTSAQLSESLLDGINNFKPSINTVSGQLKEVGKEGGKVQSGAIKK
jgi:Ca-activated chloride channel homolog